MKTYKIKLFILALATIAFSGCIDHLLTEEELPNPDVAFTYSIIDETFKIDYYVGARIKFESTGVAEGECHWDFGDGETGTGDTIVHKFNTAGTYQVRLTIEGKGYAVNPIFISDIKPILSLNPIEDEVCEVSKTYVSFNVELPNPEGLPEVYTWSFPAGTINEAGEEITTFEGKDPGKIKFSNVGSQQIRLTVTLGGRMLEEGKLNVQVAYNEAVPTIYYAVKSGNIMAYKLISNLPENISNEPFDMGVKSGQHPLNLLYNDSSLYILDCGLQFTYINDEDGNMGDGKITVMSYDGSKVETMLSNSSAAFDDPFYGYIEGDKLYFANRNTGFSSISLKERNQSFNRDEYPYYVQNDHLGYYNNGLSYGAMNACFTKINGVWYWCKTYNGLGIFRFTDSDILKEARTDKDPVPSAGIVLPGLCPKAIVYDSKRGLFYFTLFDTGAGGIYRCTLAQLETIKSRSDAAQYMIKTADNKALEPITEAGMGEGSSGEFIGICQLALDEATGDVYFGYRSSDNSIPSGLYKVSADKNYAEPVITGVQIYGVSINNKPSKLF